MSFSDLLKKPLPSKLAEEDEVTATESTEENTETVEVEGGDMNVAAEVEKEMTDLEKVDMTTEDSDSDNDKIEVCNISALPARIFQKCRFRLFLLGKYTIDSEFLQ